MKGRRAVLGFSDQFALVLMGLFFVLAGLDIYEPGQVVSRSVFRSVYERLVTHVRE